MEICPVYAILESCKDLGNPVSLGGNTSSTRQLRLLTMFPRKQLAKKISSYGRIYGTMIKNNGIPTSILTMLKKCIG